MRDARFGWQWVAAFVLCAFAASCTGKLTTPPPPDETGGTLPRCGEVGERLEVDPTTATVGAGQLFVIHGAGGTNHHRWSFVDNPSGGSIDRMNGVYAAGAPDASLPGPTVDIVRLEDTGCRDEVTVSITVLDAPTITPTRITVGRGETVTFTAAGGSGAYSWAIPVNRSGAAIGADGSYTAGGAIGRDVVRLTDDMLGSSADAMVDVALDGSLRLVPTRWAVPVGSTLLLPIQHGSGSYDVTMTGSGVESVDGATVRATAEGSATLTFTDRPTGRTVVATVRAIAPHEAPRRHASDRAETHVVGGSADFDGDGYVDVAIGMPDASGAWFRDAGIDPYPGDAWYDSGVVMIFRGTASGLDPTPARIINGESRDEELGSAVAIGDLNADGRADLIVGARRADPTARDQGAVYVYPGVDGRFFTDAPSPTLRFIGQNGFDLFGDSVALCDFNGDDLLDIAISAPYGQDPSGASDQGQVSVFLAYEGGRFISAPSTIVYGQVPDPTTMRPLAGQRLGESLAAGDFDGDGACDLAAYSIAPSATQLDTGAVTLYRGIQRARCTTGDAGCVGGFVSGSDRGGVERVPSLLWGRADGVDDDGRFGLGLAMGDVNGDGRADILAGRSLFDGAAGTDTGALYVRFGRDLMPATGLTDVAAGADWSLEGGASDRMGHAVAIFDVNHDGTDDVVSGDSRAAVMDSMISRPGLVRVYFGGGSGPSTSPDREVEGPQGNERFGIGVGVVDRSGRAADGGDEAGIVTFAPYHDTVEGENDDRGAIYVAVPGSPPTELTRVPPPSGQRVGQAVAWIDDLDGDGYPELAVGSSQTDVTGVGVNVGAVRIYRGSASGASPSVAQTLAGYAGHTESDEAGWALARAGDFDGDGRGDLAVLVRSEDLPTALDPAVYELGPGCDARRDNSGAVLVFVGQADGTLGAEPAFAYFGPEANQRIDSIDGGVDVDGDGLDDLIVGGREWDAGGTNSGGVEVIFGRARPTSGLIGAICAGDRHFDGAESAVRLGSAVAGLGDLDADGCDEFAAGSPEADPSGTRNAGEVTVYFGYGSACGATSARTMRLFGTDGDSQAGLTLAGGLDLTGDGVNDLLVGAQHFRDGRGEVGRVTLVSGTYVASRVDGTGSLVNGATGAALTVDGEAAGEQLGASLAMALLPGAGRVAILGGPFGASSGVPNTGGAWVWPVDAMGFAAEPSLRVGGESVGESQLGASVSAVRAMSHTYVAIGAPYSGSAALGDAVDDGASYALTAE